jgi:pyruvate/2-oxoglutarate dehydrogenase complex dihydrolipoamide dehydrogenase (E3) component
MSNDPNNRTKPDRTYDVLVIGGGPAGENVADIATRHGPLVAVIEHELLGGECIYWACMPFKTLLQPGEALDALRRVPGAAAAATGKTDINEALARSDALASHWDEAGQVSWLEDAGVDLLRGHGRISGERRVVGLGASHGRTGGGRYLIRET